MALVLVGLTSYTVPVIDDSGAERRVLVRKGQDISTLNISKENLKELRALTVRDQARRVIPVFMELESAFDPNRHTESGPIVSPTEKKKAEKAAETPSVVVQEESSLDENLPKDSSQDGTSVKKDKTKKGTNIKK